MEKQTANFYLVPFLRGLPLAFFSWNNVYDRHCSICQNGGMLLKDGTELHIVVRWKAAFSQFIKHLGKT